MNKFGVGSKAYLFTKNGLQYQELMLTRGFESSSETKLHFGLDTLPLIDSIVIVWPDQKFQVLKNIPANKSLTVSQRDASGLFDYNIFFPKRKSYLKMSAARLTVIGNTRKMIYWTIISNILFHTLKAQEARR
jgi:hypothetical protein